MHCPSTSRRALVLCLATALCCLVGGSTVAAEPSIDPTAAETWLELAKRSDAGGDFRCPVPSHTVRSALGGWDAPTLLSGDGADCSETSTNPTAAYEPSVPLVIPVVVHVLRDDSCLQGDLSDERVTSQIEILNEDFQAIFGTNGANGYDSLIQFELASVDPQGQPTTGITRSCDTTWFNDGGAYYNTLAWDPNRYLNIYTNVPGDDLGYVPFLPADNGGAFVGSPNDRVVVLHTSFGRNAPLSPYDLGRTTTHEVGHYLGLEHTFSGGCGTANCYTSGDLICDTNAETGPYFNCSGPRSTCNSPDPIDNYMNYSDDVCMERFTQEQTRRMLCSLRHFRPDLASEVPLFADGFESGDTTAW